MTFDVDFGIDPMTLDAEIGEIYDVSADEAERLYQEGYNEGRAAGYIDGQTAEQAVTDSIITKSISGAYENDRVSSVALYTFYGCTGLTAAIFPLAASIESNAFYGCTGLIKIDFPVATSIGSYAFYGCKGLPAVDFPTATSIEGNAFTGCTGLTKIDSPLATSIGSYAFNGCKGLTEIDFPMATSIAYGAFAGCSNLTRFVLRRTDQICTLSYTSAFNNTPIQSGTGYIYVPDELVDDYKAATNWSTFADQIKPLSELEE